MYCLTRAIDRELNKYPKVNLPNIFLLQGGYSEFVESNKDLCTKMGSYIEMDHPRYKSTRDQKL